MVRQREYYNRESCPFLQDNVVELSLKCGENRKIIATVEC